MAIVSLSNQRVTIYDADGWIMRAPVSSGRKGYETPAGIYAVIQKETEHYSNLYEDGYMPFMQRITWSGIALHGGPLPGYPASHGCVRMPVEFAERLFDLTKIGMRVIVARNDFVPVEFSDPTLASLNAVRISEAATVPGAPSPVDLGVPQSARPRQTLQSAEAKAAAARADAARPRDPDQAIGTHIFTALNPTNKGSEQRWNAVSLDPMPKAMSTPGSALDARRLDRLAALLDRSGRPRDLPEGDLRRRFASVEAVHRVINQIPSVREPFWQSFISCAKTNPAALRYIVMLMALYLHLGPYAQHVIAAIEGRIAALDLSTAQAFGSSSRLTLAG